MDGKRKALIVANDEYEDEGLERLLAPAADADALGRVLGDPKIGNFDVRVVRNKPSYVIEEQIEEILAESRSDDELLLHFSCHGLKSESGELFFAARNTRPNRLGSTAVAAEFVQRCMQTSRSRSIVLLLDCCFGGAFSQGVKVRGSGDINMQDSFPGGKLGGGRGRAVITASNAMEYAFEGDQLADDHSSTPSVFTSALVEGLASGDADRDQDGWVSLNELYDYVFDRVRERNPHQTPSRDLETQGDFYVARRSHPVTTPAVLTADLQDGIESPLAGVRLGTVEELAGLLQGRHAGRALAAKAALERLAHDDSRRVQEAAAAVLTAHQSISADSEAERLERERAAGQARAEEERLERGRAEAERLERQRIAEQAKVEEKRLERERAVAQARAEAARAEAERREQMRAAEQARAEEEHLKQERAEAERLEQERAAQRIEAQDAWTASKRAEEEWRQRLRTAELARTEQADAARRAKQASAQPCARSRSVAARRLLAAGTTLWALVPVLSLGLLAPVVLVHIAVRLRHHWLWVAFALSIATVVVGFIGAGSDTKNTALRAVGWVLLLGTMVVVSVVAFLLRSKVFASINANDGSKRHRAA